jgi:hypothetical protein
MTELAAHLAIRHAMTVAMEVRRAFELETREGGRLYVRDEWGRELDRGRGAGVGASGPRRPRDARRGGPRIVRVARG